MKFHTKYKSRIRWLLITFLMLFITAIITSVDLPNLFDKGPASSFAQEWEGGGETTFESGSEPTNEQPAWEGGSETTFESGSEPVYQQPVWEPGPETTYESPSEPVQSAETPPQPQSGMVPETTFDTAPQPVYTQPAPENTYNPEPFIPPAPVYQPPVNPQPIYNPSVQSPQNPNSQPQSQVQQPITPVTAEDYQCEGGNKVYYRVYININRAPERTGRVDYSSPSCSSGVFTSNTSGNNIQTPSRAQTLDNQQQYSNLSASCYANPTSVKVGEGVTWQVLTNGGSGSFKYDWSGDSSVNGKSDSSFYVSSYPNAGSKTARVEVKDKVTNQTVSASCSVQVTAVQTPTPTPSVTPTPTPISQAPFPTYAPIIIPVANQPQIQVANTAQNAQCPAGTIEKSRSSTQLVCEKPALSVTTITATNPVQCPAGTIEKSRTGSEILCERPIQTITTTQTVVNVTPTPTTTVVTQAITTTTQTVQCPAGTVEKSRTAQEVICERQLAQTQSKQSISTTQPTETKQPVSVTNQQTVSSIKELPKTGLPLAAIGFTALTPIGLRLKKLMGKRVEEESASDIWTKRQIEI